MKQLLLILATFVVAQTSYAQCNYADESDAPKELTRRRLKDHLAGFRYGHPYTMFNRHEYATWTLDGALTQIKTNITAGTPVEEANLNDYAKLYAGIWESAKSGEPSKCSDDQKDCPHPAWVKNNAVIYIIGLKYEVVLGKGQFTTMTQTERDSFFNNAHGGLRNLNPEVITCWGGDDCGVIRQKAMELMQYLQAYDLLKTAGAIADNDHNGGQCTARNKLRELASNVYEESDDVINSWNGWKRNHGIICAAGIGMAAIVLNDAGVETSYGAWATDWLFNPSKGSAVPHPNYSPEKWFNRANGTAGGNGLFGGEDGLEDLFFHGDHGYAVDVPQTNAEGTAGYAEGPGYFADLMQVLLPYLRSTDNALANSYNLLEDSRYQEMLKWYGGICAANGMAPTYDNTPLNTTNFLGALGDSRYSSSAQNTPKGIADLRGDYLLAIGAQQTQKPTSLINTNSGNLVLNMNNPADGSDHYFHMLCETGIPVDKDAGDGSHEDDDFSTFMIAANDNWLAIDPAYMGWGTQGYTNAFISHNLAGFMDHGYQHYNMLSHNYTISEINLAGDNFKKFTMNTNIEDGEAQSARNVNMINTHGTVYYLMNDYFMNTKDDDLDGIFWQINGNGNSNDIDNGNAVNSFSRDAVNTRIYRWSHPCNLGNNSQNWGMLTHTSVLNAVNNPPTFEAKLDTSKGVLAATMHAADNNAITFAQGSLPIDHFLSEDTPAGHPYGYHDRLQVRQTTTNTIIQSFILPYRCNNTDVPVITRNESSSDFVSTTIALHPLIDTTYIGYGKVAPPNPNYSDTVIDFHLARMNAGNSVVVNPFNIYGCIDTLTSDAVKVFANWESYGKAKKGFCENYKNTIHLRKVSIDGGSQFKYNDTLYIDASAPVSTVYYEWKELFKYEGYVSGNAHIKFYLPDMVSGIPMTVRSNDITVTGIVHNSIDTLCHFIEATLNGTGKFTIEISDPCFSCFFPPTADSIMNVFDFSTGTTETLNHDLDIVPDSGWLKMSKGSVASICTNYTLVNRDSITMFSDVKPPKVLAHEYTQIEDGPPVPSDILIERYKSKRTMIIVNDKAALVLDSGSHTHVGRNSSIIVRKGGTLYVRKGAMLEIGDSVTDPLQYGEVLCEKGSYVCIEEGADIHFYSGYDTTNLDSLHPYEYDKNLFWISMKPITGAIANCNSTGANGKFITSGLTVGRFVNHSCLAFCDIKLHNPRYGTNNRVFGWSNISRPKAMSKMKDKFCKAEPVILNTNGSLNETYYKVEVCKYDTGAKTCLTGSTLTTLVESTTDSTRVPVNILLSGGSYTFESNYYYRVRLILKNDCGERDTATSIIYIVPPPIAVITMASSACPGYGTVTANVTVGYSGLDSVKYTWSAYRIDSAYNTEDGGYGDDWSFDSTAVRGSFNFPGFYFKGGNKYVITLTVSGLCSDSAFSDTVDVPLAVKITGTSNNSYVSYIGKATVQLTGTVKGTYTSFTWSPTTALSSSSILNPVATPNASVKYVLTATNSGTGCSARDTFSINYKKNAHVGNDTTRCGSVDMLLGSKLEASLLFGLAIYKNALYKDTLTHLVTSYGTLKRLSHMLYSNNRSYYNTLNSCAPTFLSFIITYKDSFYKNPSYRGAYDAFQANNITSFVTQFNAMISANGYLNGICTTILPAYASFGTCLNNYVASFRSTAGATTGTARLSVVWGRNDTAITAWSDWIMQRISTSKTATYQYRITDVTSSVIENDSMTVYVDTIAATPSFFRAYLMDSTGYFMNTTPTSPTGNTWRWVFKDGSTDSVSTLQYPSHRFKKFDSVYSVCLTLTNICGSVTHCDTIRIDSSTLGAGYGKKGNETTANSKDAISAMLDKSTGNYLAVNIPNPFSNETMIEYGIAEGHRNAEIRISTPLGQLLNTYKLNQQKGVVLVNSANMSDGVYYYSLIVDGTVVKTKAMVVQK